MGLEIRVRVLLVHRRAAIVDAVTILNALFKREIFV